MHEDLGILQERFGDRFGGMKLTAAETIYWPIYRHKLTMSDVTTVPLNVVEEGLLRVVHAGVNTYEEISNFLGAGTPYVQLLAEQMARTWKGTVKAPVAFDEETHSVTAGPGLNEAIRLCRRSVVDLQEATLLRDGIFGRWLNCGNTQFNIVTSPKPRGDEMRWLDSSVDSIIPLDVRAVSSLITSIHSQRECETEFSEQGRLAWVELKLGVYQSNDSRRGKLLVFNERNDGEPLEEISQRLERLLLEGHDIPMHFQDDQQGSGRTFWDVLTSGLKIVNAEDELQAELRKLAVANDEYNRKRRLRRSKGGTKEEFEIEYTRGVLEALVWAEEKANVEAAAAYRSAVCALIGLLNLQCASPAPEQPLNQIVVEYRSKNMEDVARKLENHERDSREFEENFAITSEQLGDEMPKFLRDMVWDLRELGRTLRVQERATEVDGRQFEELRMGQTRIANLQSQLQRAPTVTPLATKDHQQVFSRALKDATSTIVIFSPWITMGVVNERMSEIRNALRRGCEIWIGYGMPKNKRHEDKTDSRAIEALRTLFTAGKLYLVDLSEFGGTHAKELVCDDKFYVATSFNWLSYSGRDDRRETGLLVESSTFVGKRLNECVSRLRKVLEVADNTSTRQRR